MNLRHALFASTLMATFAVSTASLAQTPAADSAASAPLGPDSTCPLAGLCEAKNTLATLWQPASNPMSTVCLTPLLIAPNRPMTVRLLSGREATEEQMQIARDTAMPTLALYRAQSSPRLVEGLRALGVDAQLCTARTPNGIPRLHTTLIRVLADTGDVTGRTWRIRLDVELGLLALDRPPGPTGSSRVWSGRFETGDLLARPQPDPHVVESFAESAAQALVGSGWLMVKAPESR